MAFGPCFFLFNHKSQSTMPKTFFGHCTLALLSVEYSTSNVEYSTSNVEYSTSNVEYSTLYLKISQNIQKNGYVRVQV